MLTFPRLKRPIVGLGWSKLLASPLSPLDRVSEDVAYFYHQTFEQGNDEPIRHYTPPPSSSEEIVETFPFDPLVLPLAKSRINDIYQEWENRDDEVEDDGEHDSAEDDSDKELDELSHENLLLARDRLPKPIRIAAIKKLLGANLEEDIVFPSPTLRPSRSLLVSQANYQDLSNGLAGSW